MFDFVLLFLITALVSAVGSLQLGLVNSEVIFTALSANHPKAKYVAFGGVIPEIIYAFCAVYFVSAATKIFDHNLVVFISSLSIIFVGLWLFFYRFPNISESTVIVKHAEISRFNLSVIRNSYILRGFILGLLNLQLLTFWVVISINISMFIPIDTGWLVLAFILGAAAGAFLILLTFISLTRNFYGKYGARINPQLVARLIGALLILIAVAEMYKYL